MDEIAVAYSDDPSKRAVLIAAALALVTDLVVTTQVHPALLRRAVRLAIPVCSHGRSPGFLPGSASRQPLTSRRTELPGIALGVPVRRDCVAFG